MLPAATAASPIRILLVEDNNGDAELLRTLLCEDPSLVCSVNHQTNLADAMKQLVQAETDIILLDLNLPDAVNLESLRRLKARISDVPIVVLTGLDDDTMAAQAIQNGAQDYIVKGVLNSDLVVRTIRHAIERHRIRLRLDAVTNDLRVANARLKRLTLIDPLTGLYNRRGLQRVLTREVQWARRERDLVVLLIDLDDFKRVNDTLGHAAGDSVLKDVAQKMKSSLRTTDYPARIGGDEFLVLLPQTRVAEGLRVAEKLRLAIAESTALRSKDMKVSASVGLLQASPECASVEELIAQAHTALKRSKTTGKNRVSSTDDAPEAGTPLGNIAETLRESTAFQALRQPIVNLTSGQFEAFEYMSRWTVQPFELPEDFFRLCMEADLLALVDHRCFKTCLAAAKPIEASMRCHINLLPGTILAIPRRTLLEEFPANRPADSFCIEISEQHIVGEPSYLSEPLNELRKTGLKVALDGVGFGRSSLESLIFLEPDFIKIDQRCIKGIARDAALSRLLDRLLKVSRALGAQTIVEGIETQEDLQALKNAGVAWGQGTLLGDWAQ